MVDSPSENSTTPCTRQRLKNGETTRTVSIYTKKRNIYVFDEYNSVHLW